MSESKQAFVPSEDRPEPKIELDRPVSEMTVRDLLQIITHIRYKTHKDHPEHGLPQLDLLHKTHKEVKEKEHIEKFKIEYFKEFTGKFEYGDSTTVPPGAAVELAIVKMVAGLTETVEKLADQVAQMKAR